MAKEKLYPFHVTILTYMTQTGVVMLSLPRILAENFGYNGWMALIGLSGIAALNIFIISLVYRLGKGKSIFQIMEMSLPKFVLYPLYSFIACIWAVTGCIVAKNYVSIFQMISFNTTHVMLLKIMVDILVYFLVIKGIYNISKALTSFYWVTSWMYLILFFYFKDFEWARMTPFFFSGETHFVEGSMSVFTSFIGYELSLLLFPYVEKGKKFMRAVQIGNLLTTLTYIIICFICFGFYSFEQLKLMVYPMLDLLSYIKLPFIERIDNLLFAFFLFTTVSTIAMYIWASQEIVKRMIPKAKVKVIVILIIMAVFFIAWIPDTIPEIGEWLQYLGYTDTVIAFGLPLMLIAILLVNKRARQ
ncbi:GerAB/ArcD/ProY family transporter [Paenibacillus harenae]|uniref:GerAB/ArcD/ProY family transporter n=1 Tax=Paenibacillus harenae TaxID=306543 RepID=UPI00278F2BA4|nr:GerAB/ArcD/ProY family transporter [Paenibacillus harenae]MDQ0060728.1 spore germination protein (amino acid permease) [Paenibacillus harenae]